MVQRTFSLSLCLLPLVISWLGCGTASLDPFPQEDERDGSSGGQRGGAGGGVGGGAAGTRDPGGGGQAGRARDGGGGTSPDEGALEAGVSDGSQPGCETSSPGKSALCLDLVPEKLQFDPQDPAFDGKGALVVEIFATATPDRKGDAGTTERPLATLTFPATDARAEVDLAKPLDEVFFDGLPPDVYVRALFVDPPGSQEVGAGLWIGGFDLSAGVLDPLPLIPVHLTPGQGRRLRVDLLAMRRLTLTYQREVGALPAGDGQGRLATLVVDRPEVANSPELFGLVEAPCIDVSGSHHPTVSGYVLGKGPYWLLSGVDDLGLNRNTATVEPGTLTAFVAEPDGGAALGTMQQLTYDPLAYKIEDAFRFTVVVPKRVGDHDALSCPGK